MGTTEQPGKKSGALPEEQYQAYLGGLCERVEKKEAAMKQQGGKRHDAVCESILAQRAGVADIHKQTQEEGDAHTDSLRLVDAPVKQYQSNEIGARGQGTGR